MKKVIKLNRSALRSLITEAIHAREPGSPLWAPEPGPVDEAEGGSEVPNNEAIAANMCEPAFDHFMSMYSDNDPVAGAYGEGDWEQQVLTACAELEAEVSAALDMVQEKLIGGEYR